MSRSWRSARGASKRGCLITLVVLAAVLYYGIPIGGHVFRYLQLLDEMKSTVQFASTIEDVEIRRRVLNKIEALGLPAEARKLTIRRTARPREIRVSTSYAVVIDLPFTTYTYTFRPEARARL